jgi:hypothetical protein
MQGSRHYRRINATQSLDGFYKRPSKGTKHKFPAFGNMSSKENYSWIPRKAVDHIRTILPNNTICSAKL